MSLRSDCEFNDLQASLWAGLADANRIELIYLLANRPHTVSELAEGLRLSQSGVSRLLTVLRERGIVAARRQGAYVLYSLPDARVIEALNLLRAVLRDNLSRRARLMCEFRSAA